MKRGYHNMMSRSLAIIIPLAVCSLFSCHESSQQSTYEPYKPDCKYSVRQIETMMNEMKKDSVSLVMIGNSLISRGQWKELLSDRNTINWGAGGDEIPCIRDRSRLLSNLHSRVWIIEAGINDLQLYSEDTILNCFQDIISIGKNSNANVIVTSIISVSKDAGSHLNGREEYREVNALVHQTNLKLKMLTQQNHCGYIDLNSALCNSEGTLKDENTTDGVHLSERAYQMWADSISTRIKLL